MNVPPLFPLEEAQSQLLEMAQPLAPETLPPEAALGRYLACPLLARRTQPPADVSAMDGYAVRADELEGPWRIIGESAAGRPYEKALGSEQAVRISTGAIMPPGAGAMLLQENAVREGEVLRLAGEDAASARHIRPAGLDFAEGDRLLAPGTRMGPAKIALALASGNVDITVHKRATLALIESGDELTTDVSQIAPHQIPASNGPMIAAMSASLVACCRRIGPVPDRLDALVESLEEVEASDVIVTSGGASVGDHDLIRPALERWGAEIAFWRIAIKPGKPLLVARKASSLVLGLPGNPASSYVTAFLFLLPLLRKLGAAARPLPSMLRLPLAASLPETGSRTEFVRAIIENGAVHPIEQRDSSALLALSNADALICCKAGDAPKAAGELVMAYPLRNDGIA